MWPLKVVVYKPVHELHIEVLIRGKGMPEEEVIVNNPPESLYLPICLWSTHSSVLVDNRELGKHDLKAVEMS